MLLLNPTDEEMIWLYGGSPYRIPSGSKKEFPENIGTHLLTHLSPKGLVELKHGDDEKDKRKEGREINRTFLKKQIHDFRKINETRQAGGFPPVLPSKDLLKIVEKVEGKESAERLEYSTQETANMMLEKMVKSQIDGQDGFATAMIQMSEALTNISNTQTEMVKAIAKLVEDKAIVPVEDKEEKKK